MDARSCSLVLKSLRYVSRLCPAALVLSTRSTRASVAESLNFVLEEQNCLLKSHVAQVPSRSRRQSCHLCPLDPILSRVAPKITPGAFLSQFVPMEAACPGEFDHKHTCPVQISADVAVLSSQNRVWCQIKVPRSYFARVLSPNSNLSRRVRSHVRLSRCHKCRCSSLSLLNRVKCKAKKR